MDWIHWVLLLIIGFAAGYFCGAGTMALMALSSRRTKQERIVGFDRDNPIQGPETVY